MLMLTGDSVIGEQLGSWKILREIGEGGMGVVYLAEHTLIGRKAAIKLLRAELSSSKDIVGRFFNEARATAAIKHSGLVDVLDFGHAPSGAAYIVMELLEGMALGHRLEDHGALPLDAALPIMRQIAAAVGAAHAKGIVHRDLKPDNVFLVNDDVAGGLRVKVLDFGIAKLMGESTKGMVKTQTGSTMGTPLYMSPEQCRGLGDIDRRADIYALGCIMFEMVTGRLPFDGEGPGDIMASHLKEPAPPPSSFAPGLPRLLDVLVLKMLAKKPAERPQTMEEVISLLDAAAGRRMTIPTLALAPIKGVALAPDGHAAGSDFDAFQSNVELAAARSTGEVSSAAAGGGRGTDADADADAGAGGRLSAARGLAGALTQMATQPPHAVAALTGAQAAPGAGSSGQLAARRTTFGGSAGESMARPPRRARWMWPVAGALTLGLVVMLLVFTLGGGEKPDTRGAQAGPGSEALTPSLAPEASPSVSAAPVSPSPLEPSVPPGVQKVKLTVTSVPEGADVFRLVDGVRVGKTPYSTEMARSEGDVVYVLKLAGHVDGRAELPASQDGSTEVMLAALVDPKAIVKAGRPGKGKPLPGVKPSPSGAASPKPSTRPTFKDGTVDPFAPTKVKPKGKTR
ncbi:MAG: serine/threonine protein kinase [Deltaproteobacteria bacterium]|nr:serine/threonine protein kinase [Deltaproteobacteria bacterium]